MYVSTSSGKIIKLSEHSAGMLVELSLDAPIPRGALVSGLFPDPSASALILSLSSSESLYLYKGKGRALGKLRGISITALGWLHPDPASPDLRQVLIGSSSGTIYAASIGPHRTKHLRTLHSLLPTQPVLGLQLEAIPADARRWLVLLATRVVLTEHSGGPTLEEVFSETPRAPLVDAVSTLQLSATRLHFRLCTQAASFCSAAVDRMCHGRLLICPQQATKHTVSSLIYEFTILPVPDGALDVVLTDYHYIVLYTSSVLAVSHLRQEPTCRVLPPCGWLDHSFVGVEHRGGTNPLWVWGACGILCVCLAHNEDRHVWQINPEAANVPPFMAADPSRVRQHGTALNFDLPVVLSAKTMMPRSEDVALRFVVAQERGALKTHLLHMLEAIGDAHAAQRTLLCAWLAQVYLRTLAETHGGGGGAFARSFASSSQTIRAASAGQILTFSSAGSVTGEIFCTTQQCALIGNEFFHFTYSRGKHRRLSHCSACWLVE